MNAYYVELARSSLGKATEALRDAEQYLIQAGATGDWRSLIFFSRSISSAENRNKELGYLLSEGLAKERS